jgi:hypothetical protein
VKEDWNLPCTKDHAEYKLHSGKQNFPEILCRKPASKFRVNKKVNAISDLHPSENGRFFAKA